MKKAFWQEQAPANSRREQRKQAFREKIMEAAIQLFEANGCEATTLEEICELAEISRPTFYSYYPSKKELIQALAEKLWIHTAAEMTDLSLANFDSTQSYIRSFFKMTQKEFSKYSRLERELIRQSMADEPGEGNNMNMFSSLTGMFEAIFKEGKKRGDIGNRYPADFLAEMSMGVISTVMMQWAVNEDYPLQKRFKQMSDFIITMLEQNK